jgi:hypothetical protein
MGDIVWGSAMWANPWTVPHENIRFVYPIRSSSIHDLKVAIHRRIHRLGLSDKLRAEVRKGKDLIFRI